MHDVDPFPAQVLREPDPLAERLHSIEVANTVLRDGHALGGESRLDIIVRPGAAAQMHVELPPVQLLSKQHGLAFTAADRQDGEELQDTDARGVLHARGRSRPQPGE
jgi:hypothetical protein